MTIRFKLLWKFRQMYPTFSFFFHPFCWKTPIEMFDLINFLPNSKNILHNPSLYEFSRLKMVQNTTVWNKYILILEDFQYVFWKCGGLDLRFVRAPREKASMTQVDFMFGFHHFKNYLLKLLPKVLNFNPILSSQWKMQNV